MLIRNSSNKAVKYLRVQGLNKFLIFDIEPGSEVSVQIPATRGDSQRIAVWGAFNDNQEISFYQRGFDRRSSQQVRSTYQILITPSGIQIEQ